MNERRPVLILTGPPGVGKTTVATLLSRRFDPGVHLESDVFFHFITAGYVEPWRPESREQNDLVMRTVGLAAASYAAAGYFTVVDGIVIPRWYLGTLREILHAAELEVSYAILQAPLELCLARVDARERGPLSDPAVLETVWAEFVDLGEYASHAVAVEERPPDEVADLVARRLADGELRL